MRRSVVLAVLVVLVTFACSSCAATGVSARRVSSAVGPAFARLYRLQQEQLGRDNVHPVDHVAKCTRNKAGDKTRGAGDDWVCIVNYPYPDGHIEPVNYDVNIQPTGCYTAQGPSQVVGQQQQRTAAGSLVTNPLFEFDGCFELG
jgi:hypothetical protein